MDLDEYIDPYRPFGDEVDTLLALFHEESPEWGLLPDGAKSYAKPIKRAFRGP